MDLFLPSVDLSFLGIDDFDLTFPGISAEFVFEWEFLETSTASSTNAVEFGEIPVIAINNISVSFTELWAEFLGPILQVSQFVLAPLQPIIDILTFPLPIFSDFAGESTTLLDLAGIAGTLAGSVFGVPQIGQIVDLVGLVVSVADALNSADPNAPEIIINIGSFDFTRDLRIIENLNDPNELINVANAISGGALQDLPVSIEIQNNTNQLFNFPLFSNPTGSFINLILGRPVDLLIFQPEDLEVGDLVFRAGIPIPILPPFLTGFLGGEIGLETNFAFGYDTFGLEQFSSSGNPVDLLDGFFISDNDNPDGTGGLAGDVPELRLTGFFGADLTLDLALLVASIRGGIFAEVNFDLEDPNNDGKVRFDELATRFALGPECVFETSGGVDARLLANVWVGLRINLLFSTITITVFEDSTTLASVNLVNFNVHCDPSPPILANGTPFLTSDQVVDANGDLNLNMGARAGNRVHGDLLDGDESFSVNHVSGAAGNETVDVSAFGVTQRYSGVSRILADGGFGRDTIQIGDGVLSNAVIGGGAGNDILKGGGGNTTIRGGAGDDNLTGGPGNTRIEGNGDSDFIFGGSGNDTLFGGTGNDVISGRGGNDQIFGESGRDTLSGNEGNDSVFGGSEDDTLSGGADRLTGGADADSLDGGTGTDTLQGQGGNDTLYGGADVDQLLGDEGSDWLFGEGGNDFLFGGAGADSISGGLGNDIIAGEEGDDTLAGDNAVFGSVTLTGGSGDDKIFGGGGSDLIYGQGGNDILLGDNGTVTPGVEITTVDSATDGNDTIHGNAGNDIILGGLGADSVFGDQELDVLLGDDGRIDFSGSVITRIAATNAGSGGGDDLHGGAGSDILFGGAGGDSLFGDQGRDILLGYNGELNGISVFSTSTAGGADTLDGGSAEDILIGGAAGDTLSGGSGNDAILGDHGQVIRGAGLVVQSIQSTLTTSGGADFIQGNAGNDTVLGGRGADSIFGGNNGSAVSGADNDVLLGDNGTVTLSGGIVTRVETASDSASTGAGDNIRGNEGDDFILGGFGTDTLTGNAGNDVLLGDHGVVNLSGGIVTDVSTTFASNGAGDNIEGNAGNDTVLGGTGSDSIFGGNNGSAVSGSDNDVLLGDNGSLTLSGGVVTHVETSSDSGSTGAGDNIRGNEGDDFILGGFGADTLTGNAGNDVLLGDHGVVNLSSGIVTDVSTTFASNGAGDSIEGNAGNDTVLGGTGSDSIFGGNNGSAVSGSDNDVLLGDNGSLTLSGGVVTHVETSSDSGSTGAGDNIRGNEGNDFILGGFGTDTLTGNAGDDVILGDHGALNLSGGIVTDLSTSDTSNGAGDNIEGNAGDDTVLGGTGSDTIFGGNNGSAVAGDDDDVLLGDNGLVTLSAGVVTRVETDGSDSGTSGAGDTIHGNEGGDVILGGFGGDDLLGETGDDTILGDNGVVLFAGGIVTRISSANTSLGGKDTIQGAAGDDILLGGVGDDDLSGDDDDDIILGDNGEVVRNDGTGQANDIFSIAPTDGGSDLIHGGDGEDIILGGSGGSDLHGSGGDTIHGDDQDDLISATTATSPGTRTT